MPGCRCAVVGCNNSYNASKRKNLNISLHRFPKNEKIRKLWIKACGKKDYYWNPSNSYICNAHFKEEDFQSNLRSQLMNVPTKRRLKETAMPSKFPKPGAPVPEVIQPTIKQIRAKKREKKNIVETLLAAAATEKPPNRFAEPVIESLEDQYNKLLEEHEILKNKYSDVSKLNRTQKNHVDNLTKQVSAMTSKLEKQCSQIQFLKGLLQRTFSKAQIDLLLGRKRKVVWSAVDMAKAFTIRYFSKRCYIYIRNKLKYPLPHMATVHRGLITDTAVMKDLMNISISLSKFSKSCVMRITARKVYFIISEEDNGPRRPLAWCELPVSFYFKEYNVVGVNDEYNEIYLEFSTALLARSLSNLKQNVKSVKIKLTNKDTPCLTLEMELMSGNIQSRQCVHDIPVEVISRKHWNDYEEPRFNDFHVSIEMPNLKSIKTMVERMRNMSHSLIVAATKDGRLTLQIKTNIVTLSAHFPDLNVESFAIGELQLTQNSDSDGEEEQKVHSIVDIKKFLMFLSGMQLNNCRTVCSIVHGKMVKLFMEQPGALSLQIFLTQLSI